jgi:hypothetical protein
VIGLVVDSLTTKLQSSNNWQIRYCVYLRSDGKVKPQGATNRDSFAFKKIFVEEHIFSVPQTDTGALVEYTKASG